MIKNGTMSKSSKPGSLLLVGMFIAVVICLALPLSANAGDAKLIVKDSGGTNTVFVVEDDARVGIGLENPESMLHLAEEDGSNPNRGIISSQHYTGTNAAVYNFKRSRGTFASPSPLTNGDAVGAFHFWGYDGSTYHLTSSIRGMINGAVSGSTVPTELWFHTGTSSSNTLSTPRMVINSTGNVKINNLSDTYTNGSAYVCVTNAGVLFTSETGCP